MSRPFVDFLPGRWLKIPPKTPGLYAVRYTGEQAVIITFVNPAGDAPTAQHEAARVVDSNEREFFYAPNDEPGHPTQADDPARYAEARANGWRSPTR